MSLTADAVRRNPTLLMTSNVQYGVDESTDQRRTLGPAESYGSVDNRSQQGASSSSSPSASDTTHGSQSRTTLNGTETADPSASSQNSIPRVQRHWTRQRVDDWLNAPRDEREQILEGFRERTRNHATFNKLRPV